MKHKTNLSILLIAASLTVASPFAEAAGMTYKFLKEIPVGGPGQWDYSSVDATGRRLYVTHGTSVTVIDLDKETVVGQITNTPGVHGFAIAPDLGRGFVSCGKEGKIAIVDLKTLETTSKVQAGKNPDAIVYEPSRQEVYAFNGADNSATIIDAKTGNIVATLPLPGKPEFAVADPKAGRIYNNIENKSLVAAIDVKTHQVVNSWPIAPGESASGMAIDLEHHRLFLGCDNKMMVMMDSNNGKVLGSVPIGGGVDANAFDPGTQLAFSSNGEGNVTIAHEEGGKLTVVQTLPTAQGARTMTIDPSTHKIYLASSRPNTPPGSTSPAVRTPPGNFRVLVFGPEK